MVYMSGSKSARNQASIVNRTNVCGGPKSLRSFLVKVFSCKVILL